MTGDSYNIVGGDQVTGGQIKQEGDHNTAEFVSSGKDPADAVIELQNLVSHLRELRLIDADGHVGNDVSAVHDEVHCQLGMIGKVIRAVKSGGHSVLFETVSSTLAGVILDVIHNG